jgi:hypothetical protein
MENQEKKTFQASVNMDEGLKKEIQEIAKGLKWSFAETGYYLLGQAVKERKRIADKNKKRTSKTEA